jgi:hypothetical protein
VAHRPRRLEPRIGRPRGGGFGGQTSVLALQIGDRASILVGEESPPLQLFFEPATDFGAPIRLGARFVVRPPYRLRFGLDRSQLLFLSPECELNLLAALKQI